MTAPNEYWPRGSLRLLAELSGISAPHMSNIVNRKVNVSKELAVVLSEASESALGFRIPYEVFLWSKHAAHPCLSGEPLHNLSEAIDHGTVR